MIDTITPGWFYQDTKTGNVQSAPRGSAPGAGLVSYSQFAHVDRARAYVSMTLYFSPEEAREVAAALVAAADAADTAAQASEVA
jgi:hypothetical protein